MLLARLFSKSHEQVKSNTAAHLLRSINKLIELIKEFEKPENSSARIAADRDEGNDGGCWGNIHSVKIQKLRKKYIPLKVTFDSALEKYQEMKISDSFELKQAFSELYNLTQVIETYDPLNMTREDVISLDLQRIINKSELRELQKKISPHIEMEIKKTEPAPARPGPAKQEMV